MKHLKIILLSLFILSFGTKTLAQWKPYSIYTGITCLIEELNFSFPIGLEWQYKHFSFEAAPVFVFGGLGSVRPFPLYQHLDFDLGVKYHLGEGIFTGLNYGYVDGPLYNRNADYPDYGSEKGSTKLRGITWSVGYRYTMKKLYLSAFLGFTYRPGYEQFEHSFFGVYPVYPTSLREGITIGFKL